MTMDSSGEMDKIVENNKKNGNLHYSEDGVSYMPSQQQLNENSIKESNVIILLGLFLFFFNNEVSLFLFNLFSFILFYFLYYLL